MKTAVAGFYYQKRNLSTADIEGTQKHLQNYKYVQVHKPRTFLPMAPRSILWYRLQTGRLPPHVGSWRLAS
jgi:hypothetical protein